MLHLSRLTSLALTIALVIGAPLAFADQKVAEIVTLARGLADSESAVEAELKTADEALARFTADPRKHNAAIRERAASVKPQDFERPERVPSADEPGADEPRWSHRGGALALR